MKKNKTLSYIITFLFSLIFSITLPNEAYATENITTNIEGNTIKLEINFSTNDSMASIILINNETSNIAYLDQSEIINNYVSFTTELENGSYSGYINTSTGNRRSIETFTVLNNTIIDNNINDNIPMDKEEIITDDSKNEDLSFSEIDTLDKNVTTDSSADKLPVTGANSSLISKITLSFLIIFCGLSLILIKGKQNQIRGIK